MKQLKVMQPVDENILSQETINSGNNKFEKPTVLVFDSGVGGLSVYNDIRRQAPDINYLYAFDNEGFPYGEKAENFIIERVLNFVKVINQRFPIDLVVIACNTASTVVLPALRENFRYPIVGVVPAIKPAVSLTKNGVIGLLATKATVSRPYTHELIENFAPSCKVELLGSSRLVTIAEEKLHGKVVDINELKSIISPWLALKDAPDVVVLGCTHFPLLKKELEDVLLPGTLCIDSGTAIARRVVALLKNTPAKRNNKTSLLVNTAICSCLNKQSQSLLPVLQGYGFQELIECKI